MNILKIHVVIYLLLFLTAALPSESRANANFEEYMEKLAEYKENLISAIEDKDIEEMKKLINFKHLYLIDEVVNPDKASGKPLRLEYNFTERSVLNTDKSFLNTAPYIRTLVFKPTILAEKKPFILVEGESKILAFEQKNDKLVLMYVFDGIVNPNKKMSLIGRNVFEKSDNYAPTLEEIATFSEKIENQKKFLQDEKLAQENMFELLHSQLLFPKVEWKVVAQDVEDYGSTIIVDSIINNTSDSNITLSKIGFTFIKNGISVYEFSITTDTTIPKKRGLKLPLNIDSDNETSFLLSEVEKGKLDLKIYARNFKYKGKSYDVPSESKYIDVVKDGDTWIYEGFTISELKKSNFTFPILNKELQKEYTKKAKDFVNKNSAHSIELVNTLLDSVQVSLSVAQDNIVLKVNNPTDHILNELQISIEILEDNIVLDSRTMELPITVKAKETLTKNIPIGKQTIDFLAQAKDIAVRVDKVKINGSKIIRDEEALSAGMIFPLLLSKEKILLNSKNIPK